MINVTRYERLKPRIQPKNETYEHWFCKIVSQAILWEKFNCKYIGMEIDNMYHYDEDVGVGNSPDKWYNKRKGMVSKMKIDCVGLTKDLDKIVGIESKANLADFKKGYCCACDYTYIICPKDAIPIDMIPNKIGLIYVDIENFKYIPGLELIGVEIVKRASKRRDKRWEVDYNRYDYLHSKFESVEDYYYDWIDTIFGYICRRNTIRMIFDSRHIPIYKKVYDTCRNEL